MNYALKGYKLAVHINEEIGKRFVIPMWEAIVISVNATISLPWTIAAGIRNYKESVALEAEMDAALIDHGFLNRAMLGLTPDDEQKIADFMKGEK